MLRTVIGYERQRGGEELVDTTAASFGDSDRLLLSLLWLLVVVLSIWAIGETGNDIEDLISTIVSVVFVLVGEFKLGTFVDAPDGDIARGDGNVPLSRAGKIFVSVLVTLRWDDVEDDENSPLRKSDGIFNDDEIDADVVEFGDDWSIWVRKAFSVDELSLSLSI